MILITAVPRCGTTYISKLLTSAGLNINHEMTMGEHGIASWPLAAGKSSTIHNSHESSAYPWGPKVKPSFFSYKLHQVRHPLSYMSNDPSSILKESRSFLSDVLQLKDILPGITTTANKEEILLFHMIVWHEWNLMAENLCDWTYRIEALPAITQEFVTRLGSPSILKNLNDKIKKIPKNINSRKKLNDYKIDNTINWVTLEKLDKSLTYKIKKQAVRYGYDLNSFL